MTNVDQGSTARNHAKTERDWSSLVKAGLIGVALIAILSEVLAELSDTQKVVATTIVVLALVATLALQIWPPTGTAASISCNDYKGCIAWLLALGGGALVIFVLVRVMLRSSADPGAPLMVLVGVIVLLIVVSLVTFTFSVLNLASAKDALGLPDGSVRAIIALMLLVLFSIISFFLYRSIATANPPNAQAVEIAKQLITLLGTLVTAVASFYFGSNAVQTAHETMLNRPTAASTTPAFKRVNPSTLKPGTPNQPLTLEGTNLGGFSNLHLEQKEQADIDAQVVGHTDSTITAQVSIPSGKSGTWKVVISDNVKSVPITTIEIKN